MNIVVEKQPKCLATLRAEVPAEKVTQEREKLFRNITRQVKLPGFRPGKVPRKVIEKRFGESIAEDLQTALIRQAVEEGMKQEELRVLEFHEPEAPTFHQDGTFSFHCEMVLAPEFPLPEYKGLEIEVPKLEVTDEMVEQNIDKLREQHAEFKDIEPRPVAEGDVAVINYTTTLDGKPVEEAVGKPVGYLEGREDYWVAVDEGSFLPGFASQLVGMNSGEKREVKVTLPEDFPVADLRGREVVFDVELTGLKEKIVPELTDEFAAELVPDTDVEGLRTAVRESLLLEVEKRISNYKVEQVINHLVNQAHFELPDELLTNETQSQADDLVQQGVNSGMSEEQIAEQEAEIFNAAGQRAQNSLRSNFILQRIAEEEGIEVSDHELVEHITRIAHKHNQPVKKVFDELNKQGRVPGIRNGLLIGKTIDFLVDQAVIREVEPPPPEEQAAEQAAEAAETPASPEETSNPPENQ